MVHLKWGPCEDRCMHCRSLQLAAGVSNYERLPNSLTNSPWHAGIIITRRTACKLFHDHWFGKQSHLETDRPGWPAPTSWWSHRERESRSNYRMDGRMDGWMDDWVGGCVGGWMDGWMDGWVNGWMNGWMNKWMNEWMFNDRLSWLQLGDHRVI